MSGMQGGISIHLRRVAQSDHAAFHFFVRSTMKGQKLDSSGRFRVDRRIAPEVMSNGEA
jgi:hypothetical protein